MARIVCQVIHRRDRITFLWSEGAASFEPYHLEGEESARLLAASAQIHANLPQAPAGDLVRLGHQLFRAIFRMDAADRGSASTVQGWLDGLRNANAIERIEFLCDTPGLIPWNLLTDDSGSGQQFWGVRYPIGSSRRVNALRTNPTQAGTASLCAVDDELAIQLSAEQKQQASPFVQTVTELASEVRRRIPDILLLQVRCVDGQLRLGSETFSVADLRSWMDESNEGTPDPLVILLSSGESSELADWQAILASASSAFAGLIANETFLPANQSFDLGQRIIRQFTDGTPIGEILRSLRHEGGAAALALTAFCPLTLRVVKAGEADIKPELHVLTVPLPAMPYRPFAAFDDSDRALFYGREEDAIRAAQLLDHPDVAGVLVHGSPAVGKTSFLQAGLLPYLETECVGFRILRDRTPGDGNSAAETDYPKLTLRCTNDLAGQFADALAAFCAQPYAYTTPTGTQVTVDLPKLLQTTIAGKSAVPSTAIQSAPAATSVSTAPMEPTATLADGIDPREVWIALRDNKELLGEALDAVTRSLPFELVIAVDQGEDLLSQVRSGQEQVRRKKALEMLAHLADVAPRCKIIYAIRSQSLGHLVGFFPGGRVPGDWSTFYLRPLTEAEMVQALAWPTNRDEIPYCDEVPHQKYRFTFDAGTAEQIVADAIEASGSLHQSALSLIQAVGAALYQRQVVDRKQSQLRSGDVKDMGGVKAALAACLSTKLDRLPVTNPTRNALRDLMGKLATSHADGSVSRDLTASDDLRQYWPPAAEPVETAVNAAAENEGLLEVQYLMVGGQVGQYVSLPQDSLARLGQELSATGQRRAEARKTIADVLWIMIPLAFAAAVFTWWLTRHYDAQQLETFAKKFTDDQEEEFDKVKKKFGDQIDLVVNQTRRLNRVSQYQGLVAQADQALRADNALRARQLLLSQPAILSFLESREKAKLTDLRGFEWKHLWRQLNAERHALLGHLGAVNAVAVSPDSQWAASASADGTVRIWNLGKGEVVGLISGDKFSMNAVAFSPDGKSLATAGADKLIRVWNLADLKNEFITLGKNKLAATLTGHEAAVNALTFGKDGNTLASAGADKAVVVWDVAKSAKKHTLSEHTAAVHALVASDKGAKLVSVGADGRIVLWDADSGKKLAAEKTAYPSFTTLALSSDGKMLATSGVETKLDAELGMIRFWNVADLKEIPTPIQHGAGVLSLTFTSGGNAIVSGGKDHVIRMWDVKSKTQLRRYLGHLSGIRALAFSGDGKTLLSGDFEGVVKAWNPAQSSATDVIADAHPDWVQCLALNRKGTLLASGARDGSVKLWDPADGRLLKSLPVHAGSVTAVAFSFHAVDSKAKDKADAKDKSANKSSLLLAVATRDEKKKGEVKIWQLDPDFKAEPKMLHTLSGHDQGVTCLEFHPFPDKADLLLSGSADRSVILWDAMAGKQKERWQGHKDEVRCLAFSHDPKAFVSGSKDGSLVYCEIDRKATQPLADMHLGSVESIAMILVAAVDEHGVHGKQGFLTGSTDQTMRVVLIDKDAEDKVKATQASMFRSHTQPITAVAHNDGARATLLVSASLDGTIKLFDRRTETFLMPSGGVKDLDLSQERLTLTGHEGPVRALVIAADQSFLVSAGNDKSIRIWRTAEERRK